LFAAAQGAVATAAEVRVWAGGVIRPVLAEVKPRFERDTPHRLIIEYGSSPEFARHLAAGQSFDAAILIPATIDDWIRQGKIAVASRVNIAQAGLGVAVRAGAAKPDVASVAALKQALLDAKSVAHSSEGPTRAQLMRLLDRLGIADQMQPKLKPFPGGGVLKSVAEGNAEMVIAPIPTIVSTAGVLNAGPLPAELQTYLQLTAGAAAGSRHSEAANAFLATLTSPATGEVLKAKGFEPFK
jgi:molybdate transport system substrate-binding protein